MKKTMLSKFFRVAQEGDTIDGRKISRDHLQQAESNFKTGRYGARAWLEHIRGTVPGGPFDALGDVYAIKTQDDDGILGLYAQVEPLPTLMAMHQAGQKIYTSIEISMRDSSAWLSGLAFTDSPASLGTERMAFSSTNNTGHFFKGPTLDPEHYYSTGIQVDLEFSEQEIQGSDDDKPTLLSRVKELLSKNKASDKHFSDIDSSVVAIATSQDETNTNFSALQVELKEAGDNFTALKSNNDKLQERFNSLETKLKETTPALFKQRPGSTGGEGSASLGY